MKKFKRELILSTLFWIIFNIFVGVSMFHGYLVYTILLGVFYILALLPEAMYEVWTLKFRRHSTKSAITNLGFDMQAGMLTYDDYVKEYDMLSEHFDILERAIKIYRAKLNKELNK